MGYPMTYSRVLSRSELRGNYTHVRDYGYPAGTPGAINRYWDDPKPDPDRPSKDEIRRRLCMIAGDLRRLEADSRDGGYACQRIAAAAGVEIEIVQRVLTAFFEDAPRLAPHDSPAPQTAE